MALDLFGRPIVTAADLDGMTHWEVEAVWQASIVTDAGVLPAEYVERLRARARRRLADLTATGLGPVQAPPGGDL